MRTNGGALGFLAGVALALLASGLGGRNVATVLAQTATHPSEGGELSVSTSGANGRDLIIVLDSKTRRLGIYTLTGKELVLQAVRNVEFDLRAWQYAAGGVNQTPAVDAMKAEVEKWEKQKKP